MADRKARILIVDDEPPVVRVLSEYLIEQGFDVRGVFSGVQALARMSQEQPDVVLLDVRMPELDGVEVLRRIRDNYPRIPVLMVSGNDDVELAKETVTLGAFDYILKPIDFPYLRRAVDKMLAAAAAAAPSAAEASEVPDASPSAPGLLYDVALEIFKATRALPPMARESVGIPLEKAALNAVLRGVVDEKLEMIRALNQIRTLLRFGRDLGDLSDDEHRRLEAHVARARRSVGLS